MQIRNVLFSWKLRFVLIFFHIALTIFLPVYFTPTKTCFENYKMVEQCRSNKFALGKIYFF